MLLGDVLYVGMNMNSFKIVLEMIIIFPNKFMKWFGILCGFLRIGLGMYTYENSKILLEKSSF